MAVVVWSFYTIGSRRAIAQKGYSPLTVTSVLMFTTTTVFFIVSLFTFQPRYLTVIAQPSTLFLFLHLGILVTVVTYLLYQWAVKHTSATTASLQNYLGPA